MLRQLGELTQEREGACRRTAVDRARHEEAAAALLERPRRGDQRAGLGRRLDDHGRIGQPADDPVPPRERALRRFDVRGELRHDGTTGGDDRISQADVCRRAERRVAAPDDCHGRAASTKRGFVRRAVDAVGQPGHDGRIGRHEGCGDPRCRRAPGARRPSRTHDRDGALAGTCVACGPRRYSTCGGIAMAARRAGYDGSSTVTTRTSSARSRRTMRSASWVSSAMERATPSRMGWSRRAMSSGGVAISSSTPSGRAAAARTSRAEPKQRSRAPNPIGPRPWTDASTAHASRSGA